MQGRVTSLSVYDGEIAACGGFSRQIRRWNSEKLNLDLRINPPEAAEAGCWINPGAGYHRKDSGETMELVYKENKDWVFTG